MQCSIPPLQPNKRIGIVIPFHLHLFPGIVIPFPNGIGIPQTKRGINFYSKTFALSLSRTNVQELKKRKEKKKVLKQMK
jgi:hypothetical protein